MKKIILGLPQTFSLYASIKKNLEFHGYTVIDISYPNHDFQYRNFGERITNTFRKLFLNDKHYKNKLKFKPYQNEITNKLKSVKNADAALLIRADIYPEKVIKLIKSKSNQLISYHWDGLARFPQILDYITYFDRFFIFDPEDFNTHQNNHFFSSTNFYFDYYSNTNSKNDEFDIFYIGSTGGKRVQYINNFIEKTEHLNLNNKFLLHFTNSVDVQENTNIEYIDKHKTYDDNISFVKRSAIIFDLVSDSHQGLSFRFFEGLQLSKKLITNNPSISKYDFYHPNNIFIWDGESLEGFEDFLKLPYQEIPKEVKEKYSFKNWIKYLLNEKPYTVIDIPR
ncbi:hypothetical protein [Flavicella marina]|uniref:hypothetical protein n=1 Tax=Flavicella marina TaxID=1475951 RepID=UPI001263F142|nr:hypothetical protein [Flavicella marina]